METQIWSEFLVKQVPIVIVLSIFCYCMYRYFTKTVEQKDAVIKEKDDEIRELHEKMLELTGRCIEAQNKNADATFQLKEVLLAAMKTLNK